MSSCGVVLEKPSKPLGGKAYGSIPHIPGSRIGRAERCITEGQCRILTEKVRDRHDFILVQEKVDGACCSVARVDGHLWALTRSGYPAVTSPYPQFHVFAAWVEKNKDRFEFLRDGERLVGEWMHQAHGTRYNLGGKEPFIVFDFFQDGKRACNTNFLLTFQYHQLPIPWTLHVGGPCSIEKALERLGEHGHHGAIDRAEGCVWRCERKGEVDFLAKYVRLEKIDGKYLPEVSGCAPVYNCNPLDE